MPGGDFIEERVHKRDVFLQVIVGHLLPLDFAEQILGCLRRGQAARHSLDLRSAHQCSAVEVGVVRAIGNGLVAVENVFLLGAWHGGGECINGGELRCCVMAGSIRCARISALVGQGLGVSGRVVCPFGTAKASRV